MFDFFGYGQPSNAGPANDGHGNNLNANHGPAPLWGLWLDGPEAQDDAPFMGPPVNPQGPATQNDPQPAPQPLANDFLEVNDLAMPWILI